MSLLKIIYFFTTFYELFFYFINFTISDMRSSTKVLQIINSKMMIN